MKLLWLQASSLCENYGGIEYYLDDVLTSACDLWGTDSQTTIVPRRTSHFKRIDRPYSLIAVRFSRLPILSKWQNRFSCQVLLQALRQVSHNRPDFIVSGHVSLGPLTATISRLTGVPYLCCAYGLETWGRGFTLDEWALQGSAGILSISHWTKNLLVKRGYPESKIHIIHPRLDPRFENREFPDNKTASKTLRLLSVSRLDREEQYKGQDHALQALHLLKNRCPDLCWHYTIRGDGSDRSRLEQMVVTWGLQDQVSFKEPSSDRAQLESLYRESDIFLMPSRFGKWERRWRGEGFGIVYLEAAAQGVPSIAYHCGGITDIFEDGKTALLVEPDNITQLSQAMQRLAENPALRMKIAREAHSHTLKNFTKSSIDRQISQAFRAIQNSLEEKNRTFSIAKAR